ncbi:MAG: DEAD/DEAH box helicase, partial [Ahrensia sp.]
AIAPTILNADGRFDISSVPTTLVVAPTRELAMQVMRELTWLYAETGAKIATCVGGMDMRDERRALGQGANIVVGTPGRLRDHIHRGSLDMTGMRAIVMDEADEMLDLGFREDLEFILETAPEDRRTLLFSATVPRMIANLAKKYQRDAMRIMTAGEKDQHVDIEYRAMPVANGDRDNAIINVLRYYDAKNALVFCNTRATVNHMMARFNNRGFAVVALSGELSQAERTHALQAMRDGRARVCIATDVAARGIDLPGLELVIHADLPSNKETLLHRSGRTGRAGSKGVSALIVEPRTRRKAERLLGDAKIDAIWAAPPNANDVSVRDNERLMASPLLTEPVAETETELVAQLLAAHGPEALAAAVIRQYRKENTAPEELRDAGAVKAPEKGKARDDFGASVWVSLSVGRNQNAEPRWLLPILCAAGGLTKKDIGFIKLMRDETFVQISTRKSDAFFSALGGPMMLEKSIRVTPLEGEPDFSAAPREESPVGKKPFRKDRGPREDGPKREGRRQEGHKPDGGRPDRPKPEGGKPPFKKAKGKPSFGKNTPPKKKHRKGGAKGGE